MDPKSLPQTDSQTGTSTSAGTDSPDTLARLTELAEQAAGNPHTSEPLRELVPLLVAVVRQQAEMLVLLGA